jgi:hypothetical protein
MRARTVVGKVARVAVEPTTVAAGATSSGSAEKVCGATRCPVGWLHSPHP